MYTRAAEVNANRTTTGQNSKRVREAWFMTKGSRAALTNGRAAGVGPYRFSVCRSYMFISLLIQILHRWCKKRGGGCTWTRRVHDRGRAREARSRLICPYCSRQNGVCRAGQLRVSADTIIICTRYNRCT